MLTIDKIYEAQKVLRGIARTTPLTPAPALGNTIYIKNENLQMTGSFKLRGAYNKLKHLSDEEKAHGVVACSAGNHAQGVALSATMMGIKSVICMPAGAPIAKVEATRGFGAEVVLVPGVYDDAAREAERLSREEGYTFAHPFNDEYVMAGQGTIALEILDQLPEVEQIVVPIGGGGLIAGIAVAVKTLKPSCKVIGVQAAGAPSMYNAVKMGYIEELKSVATIADGIAVKKPGDLTYDCFRRRNRICHSGTDGKPEDRFRRCGGDHCGSLPVPQGGHLPEDGMSGFRGQYRRNHAVPCYQPRSD